MPGSQTHGFNSGATRKRLLIVEADFEFRNLLADTVAWAADAETADDFLMAHARLLRAPVDLVVANLQLGFRDAIGLAYLLAGERRFPRFLAYSATFDAALAHEFQRARAFYESRARLPYALPAYLDARLPVLDRRNPAQWDRRIAFRGGRRASDVPLATLRP